MASSTDQCRNVSQNFTTLGNKTIGDSSEDASYSQADPPAVYNNNYTVSTESYEPHLYHQFLYILVANLVNFEAICQLFTYDLAKDS